MQQAIDRLMRGRTAVVIAHRLSTDAATRIRIAVLEPGSSSSRSGPTTSSSRGVACTRGSVEQQFRGALAAGPARRREARPPRSSSAVCPSLGDVVLTLAGRSMRCARPISSDARIEFLSREPYGRVLSDDGRNSMIVHVWPGPGRRGSRPPCRDPAWNLVIDLSGSGRSRSPASPASGPSVGFVARRSSRCGASRS